jgi:hypothetical protein
MSKACKKPVPYLWALPLKHRNFGKLKSSTACTTQFTRPIMEVSQSLIQALQEAKTPEEAYKVFASTASQLMQDAMTKELADAIGRAKAVTDGNPEIAGWEASINGMTLTGCWGTPGIFTSATDKTASQATEWPAISLAKQFPSQDPGPFDRLEIMGSCRSRCHAC